MKYDHTGPTFPPQPGKVYEFVPCRLCREPTFMLHTKLCDNCWEISRRTGGWSLWQFIMFWWRDRK